MSPRANLSSALLFVAGITMTTEDNVAHPLPDMSFSHETKKLKQKNVFLLFCIIFHKIHRWELFFVRTFFTSIRSECEPLFASHVFLWKLFQQFVCFEVWFGRKLKINRIRFSFLPSQMINISHISFCDSVKNCSAWFPFYIIQWIEIETILKLIFSHAVKQQWKRSFSLFQFHPQCNNSRGFVSFKVFNKFTLKSLSVSPASFALQHC